MDPNAVLDAMRAAIANRNALAERFHNGEECGDALDDAAYHAAVQAEALDDWLTRGGALPDAWRRD